MLEHNNQNIWNWYDEGRWIVITTNIGYKKDGSCPMGAGIARQAASLYPDLPGWYGAKCKEYGAETAVLPYVPGRFFLFPTKPLNEFQPWLSWQGPATLDLIVRSVKQLVALINLLQGKYFLPTVGLPLVGCENGGLPAHLVLAVLNKLLDDRFILFPTKID